MVTASPAFDLFLGIDWSGAKGSRNKGIQVAAVGPGAASPELIGNPYQAHGIWSRPDILAFLEKAIADGHRILAGFDFAFCYAFEDAGAYFPGLDGAPATPEAVWATVEAAAADDPHFYGAALYQRADLPYRDYFMAPGWLGELYRHRQRLTERVSASVTTPHPVFKCIGAANVGTGSLAGMRLLHRLGARADVRIWPFDATPGAALTVVEIFPRLYFKRAGGDPRRWGDPENLTNVCRHYGCAAPVLPSIRTEDEADALVSAAALRALGPDGTLWRQAENPGAATEGWIFGAA